MFHIHSIYGVQFNVPLESLGNEELVDRIEKSYGVRKILDKNYNKQQDKDSDEKFSIAVKAYKEAVKIDKKREPILHAYTIMKSPVLTLDPEMNIADALNLLRENNVCHMPVLSTERKIIGIVSDRDILKYISDIYIADNINNNKENKISKTVADIMTKKVITADKLTDIRRIAKAMFERHIGTMPVVDDSGQLIGIITRSDILYALINYPPLSLWA